MKPTLRPPRVVLGAPIDACKLELARRFRRRPTPAEATAWQALRARKVHGLKFRRQQIIAGFVVDFYCPALRLALELDGGVHDAHRGYDLIRTQILNALDVRVVRLANDQVDPHALCVLLAPFTCPPLPTGRGGKGG